jgi:hypothetical protein
LVLVLEPEAEPDEGVADPDEVEDGDDDGFGDDFSALELDAPLDDERLSLRLSVR